MTRRIHIVGSSPRTGTTLLAELMPTGFSIDGTVEHERSILSRKPVPAVVALTKSPGEIGVVAKVLATDPALWVLHMVRDPRDVVVSRHRKAPDRYWTHLGYWHHNRRFARALEGHPRFKTVRYEDLVADPDAIQEEIEAWLPWLHRTAPFSAFHKRARPSADSVKALGGLRPISTSSIGAWRDHKPRIVAQLARYGSIDDDLQALGYETDGTWHEALSGVEPGDATSVVGSPGKAPSLKQRWRRFRRLYQRRRRIERAREQRPLADPGPFQLDAVSVDGGLLEIGRVGTGVPVILLAGLGGSGTQQMALLGTALAGRGFEAIAVNRRGVGSSNAPLDNLTLRDLARDIAHVIDHVGAPAYVVGRAFGNRVARCVATDYPDKVRALVLLAAGGLVPPRPASESAPPVFAYPHGQNWTASRRAEAAADKATPAEHWWDAGRSPVLVIQGLEDRVALPENGRQLALAHPDRVELVELEETGHYPLAQRPGIVTTEVVRYLQAREAAAAG